MNKKILQKESQFKQQKAYKAVLKAAVNPDRPVLAQLVVTRRCNLSCGYCFEYDNFSKPIPLNVLKQRINDLKRLKTLFVTLNGGEALLHPQIVDLVQYISDLDMIPMINSNGHVLKQPLIEKLNKAGLFGIQLSCDTLIDNDITKKSMKRLQPKLELLKKHAKFRVRVNSVIGSGPAQEVKQVADIVLSYGFDFQCSLMRDENGRAIQLTPENLKVYQEIRALKNRLPSVLHDNFQLPLAKGDQINWKCRAGARHFEIDENGLVHLCQPRTGTPAKKLEQYTVADIREQFNTEKSCAAKCPVAYAHLASRIDKYRSQKQQQYV